MFVGHYAAAIGATSIRPRRGVLTYTALSSVLPDLFMLGTTPFGCSLNYHADLGLLLCTGVVVALGLLFRFDRFSIGLALACLVSHLPLDLLYVTRDRSNLYAHPWIDFPLEAGLILGASAFFLVRSRPSARRRTFFLCAIASLLLLQGAWGFGGGFFMVG